MSLTGGGLNFGFFECGGDTLHDVQMAGENKDGTTAFTASERERGQFLREFFFLVADGVQRGLLGCVNALTDPRMIVIGLS